MDEITIIKGYHYGSSHRHPYFDNRKAFYWRITPKTTHSSRLKKGISAVVSTRYGKKHVVVDDIQKVTGEVALRHAKWLKPVIDVRNHGLVRMFKKWYEYDKKHNRLN